MRQPVRLLAVLALAFGLAGCGVNDIPTYEEQAKANWAQVQNQYQRRADLFPNLVETVKGYAAQERETLEAVVKARAAANQTTLSPEMLNDPAAFQKFQEAQGQLGSALSRLMVVVERYPDLKSAENFRQLQTQLEGTENRIAVARRDYIEAVRLYNTELVTLPGRIWASLLYSEKQQMQTFTTAPENATVPSVKFN